MPMTGREWLELIAGEGFMRRRGSEGVRKWPIVGRGIPLSGQVR